MFGTIKMSKVAFFARTANLKKASNSLAAVSAKFHDYESTSNVLDLYKTQFSNLSKLIKIYSTFLNKDIELMNQSGKVLIEMDQSLGNSLRKLN